MSLVNQMLKDLAQRSKPTSDPNLILIGLATSQPSTKKNKLHYWFITTSLLLLLIAGVFILMRYFFHNNTTQTQQVMTLNIPIENPALSRQRNEVETTIQPVVLTGIALQTKDNESNLRLLLNQNVLYRVTGDDKDRLVIVLENTHSVSDLPLIDTLNSGIKNIRMFDQPDGSLKIILNLNPGVQLKQLALLDSPQFPELNIDLTYNAIVANKEKAEILRLLEKPQNPPMKKSSYDTTIDDEYQNAIQPIDAGQPQDAEIRLTKFLAKYPKFAAARTSYATLLLKDGKFVDAQKIIDAGLEQLPSYPPYVQLKAQILVDTGKIKQALNLLRKAPPDLEDNPEYHAFLAALYQRENEPRLAEKLYEQLVIVQPNNSIWWMGLAVAREALNKNDGALQAYTRAINAEDLSPELKVYVENRIHLLS